MHALFHFRDTVNGPKSQIFTPHLYNAFNTRIEGDCIRILPELWCEEIQNDGTSRNETLVQ